MAENKNKLTDEQKIAYNQAVKTTNEQLKKDPKYESLQQTLTYAEERVNSHNSEIEYKGGAGLSFTDKEQETALAILKDADNSKQQYKDKKLEENFKNADGKGLASEVKKEIEKENAKAEKETTKARAQARKEATKAKEQARKEAKKEKSITNKIKKFASKMVDKLTKKSSKKTNTGPGSSPVGKKQEAKKGKGRT